MSRGVVLTQDGQQDVDEQIATASSLKEDTERWEDDGDDDLADVAATNKCQSRCMMLRGIAGMIANWGRRCVLPRGDSRSCERHLGYCGI